MARKTTRSRKAVKRGDAASAFRSLTRAARQALDAGVETTRKLAAGTAAEARRAALARAGEARARTLSAVTHLEKVFETRVSQAIARLGVPTSRDVRALSREVAQLRASVEQLKRARARA